jgi:hypothetical protein
VRTIGGSAQSALARLAQGLSFSQHLHALGEPFVLASAPSLTHVTDAVAGGVPG